MSVSKITYNEAMTMLQAMFADVDPEVLREVLIASNGHMERTVETLLSMTSSASTGDDRNLTNPTTTTTTTTPTSSPSPPSAPPPQQRDRQVVEPPVATLPSDFLQIPELTLNNAGGGGAGAGGASPQSNQLDQDYQMALMLQRQEYEIHARDDRQPQSLHSQPTTITRQSPSPPNPDASPEQAASGADIDFGPLKEKLTHLSATAKHKFLQLKQKYFSGRGGGSRSNASSSSRAPASVSHQYQVVDQTDSNYFEAAEGGGIAMRLHNQQQQQYSNIADDQQRQQQDLEFDFESHNTSLLEESNRNKAKRD